MAIAIKEHPIIFSAEMVRAILDDHKTQTRRVVKPQPILTEHSLRWCWPLPKRTLRKGCCGTAVTASREWWEYVPREAYPYGAAGDRLWVRETWAIEDCGRRVDLSSATWAGGWPLDRLEYCATDVAPSKDAKGNPYWWNKRPSIFMPRWASRVLLEVVNVRADRVQDISEQDATAEGAMCVSSKMMQQACRVSLSESPLGLGEKRIVGAKEYFRVLWDSINAKRGYGWGANPWVWVIEFKVLETGE